MFMIVQEKRTYHCRESNNLKISVEMLSMMQLGTILSPQGSFVNFLGSHLILLELKNLEEYPQDLNKFP